MTKLFPYQEKAVSQLRTGSILWGSVGSGKSMTALGYFYTKVCGGSMENGLTPPTSPKDLYVITVAQKRDLLDWQKEAARFAISTERESSIGGIKMTVDSWNNVGKYKNVKGAFFIFDEQKVAGSGSWVRSFLKIAKQNDWILLSATPGDTWIDYVPVFVANGFYKNRTDFISQHVVYNTFAKYPKIDRYVNEAQLKKYEQAILVEMEYENKTKHKIVEIVLPYNAKKFERIFEDRWNPFHNRPIQGAAEACYAMRQVVNSDPSRLESVLEIFERHKKLIVFYNFDYELDILRRLNDILPVPVAEYNGHLHEPLPEGESWIYIAHYISAGEAWNCTTTNAVVLYSRNYSYRATIQAMGRIDRQNTPYPTLYYYFLTSNSPIDKGIKKAFLEKKNFNEQKRFKNRFA